MVKIYGHLRVEDLTLQKKIKIRAATEGRTAIELVERAIKEYLKKPVQNKR